MAAVRKITRDDHTVMPWKNGGGTTRQIATGGDDAVSGDWGWRVSFANVERDGAYSEFPGIDRLTTVVIGHGTDLIHPDGSSIALNPLQPTLIPSDVALWGMLRDEPIVNLNVMTRQGQYTASVEIVDGPAETTLETGESEVLLVYVLAGTCRLHPEGGDPCDGAEPDTLIHDGQEAFALSPGEASRVAVIRIAGTVRDGT